MSNVISRYLQRISIITRALPHLSLRSQSIMALVAGALGAFAYAPFSIFLIGALYWAVLWLLWQNATPRRAMWLGFVWAFGQFWASAGWLFVAFHTYGGLNPPLTVLLLSIFFAYFSVWAALAGWLYARLRGSQPFLNVLIGAACWTSGEWVRGWFFTGMPWLSIGYSQTPPSPLAGYAPLFGSYGTGFILVCFSGLLVLAFCNNALRLRAMLAALAIVAIGAGLRMHEWTYPIGTPISVALIQPNVPQDLKWDRSRLEEWLVRNIDLARQNPAQLVAFPETTLPLMESQLPDGYLDSLSAPAQKMGGDVITGAFTRDAEGHIYNSAISHGTQPRQLYLKQHLLPFGEFLPKSLHWLLDLVDIPMADQTHGPAQQPPMHIGDQLVAVNICYEDVFGEELIYALPQATLMLNMSNLAWYGDSSAQPQHLQIARFRAMEAGRPMLRSTNTGMTAIVMPDGSVPHVMQAFTTGALQASVRGYAGMTPFARWGNWPVLAVIALTLVVALARRKRPALIRRAIQTLRLR